MAGKRQFSMNWRKAGTNEWIQHAALLTLDEAMEAGSKRITPGNFRDTADRVEIQTRLVPDWETIHVLLPGQAP